VASRPSGLQKHSASFSPQKDPTATASQKWRPIPSCSHEQQLPTAAPLQQRLLTLSTEQINYIETFGHVERKRKKRKKPLSREFLPLSLSSSDNDSEIAPTFSYEKSAKCSSIRDIVVNQTRQNTSDIVPKRRPSLEILSPEPSPAPKPVKEWPELKFRTIGANAVLVERVSARGAVSPKSTAHESHSRQSFCLALLIILFLLRLSLEAKG
jgi:hypothetical protein